MGKKKKKKNLYFYHMAIPDLPLLKKGKKKKVNKNPVV